MEVVCVLIDSRHPSPFSVFVWQVEVLSFALEHFLHLFWQMLSRGKLGIVIPVWYHIDALIPLKNDFQVFFLIIVD